MKKKSIIITFILVVLSFNVGCKNKVYIDIPYSNSSTLNVPIYVDFANKSVEKTYMLPAPASGFPPMKGYRVVSFTGVEDGKYTVFVTYGSNSANSTRVPLDVTITEKEQCVKFKEIKTNTDGSPITSGYSVPGDTCHTSEKIPPNSNQVTMQTSSSVQGGGFPPSPQICETRLRNVCHEVYVGSYKAIECWTWFGCHCRSGRCYRQVYTSRCGLEPYTFCF